ncbi:acyltransferase family protein [uncultured Peptoniphilus sp.]|uniref:acyltransferase n=1 Tax=uncultured Peptoniphilus sp. TaxID=254354 RepID=UPI0028064377|nr:acyltransferase family protein [uncultured Peptoniphilus sp.]
MNRENNFDLLRICMAFYVVLLHTSASYWNTYLNFSKNFIIMSGLNFLTRCSVPVFFMISGYFMFKRELSVSKILKSAARIYILYIVFTILFAIKNLNGDYTINNFIECVINGYYHLWFLKNLAWAYLFIPIYKSVIEYKDGYYVKYVILLFLVFGILKYNIQNILPIFENSNLSQLFDKFTLYGYSDTTLYLFLGYYLGKIKINTSSFLLFFIYFIISIIGIALESISLIYLGEVKGIIFDNFGILIFLQSILIFLAFKNLNINKNLNSISNLSLGVYLFHPIFLEKLTSILNFSNLFIQITFLALATFILTAIFVYLIRFIPFIKKYL